MTTLPEKATKFFENVSLLQSFPVFIGYLLMILLIPVWKRILPVANNLKMIMIPYNIICVLLSLAATFLLFYGAFLGSHLYAYEENQYIVYGMAIYTISKNVELLDTVFMILRHKYRQISFLHVFHHSTILVLGNYAFVYTCYPPIAVPVGLNSLVHVPLYAYYAKTAISPSLQVSWKKALTIFQIVQFLFDLVFATIGYLYHGFCIYSIMYGGSMLVLFSNFYYFAYIKKKKTV
eukprot:TCONS_00004261-protein